eukprot:6193812-Pleurochrysis_carterae.AAC.4
MGRLDEKATAQGVRPQNPSNLAGRSTHPQEPQKSAEVSAVRANAQKKSGEMVNAEALVETA